VSPPRPGEEPLERRAIISGIGQSDVGRRLGRSELDLTIEAGLRAIEDAGLTRDDIDGLSTYPGMGAGTSGFAGPTSPEVQDAMGLSLNWHDGGGEGAGQMRAVHTAALAVAAGLARHVLVYRTVTEGSAQGTGGRAGIGVGSGGGGGNVPRFGSFMQWSLPFGAASAANWLAMVAQRRMYEFGLTREQLGAIAINNRANAALNPKAIYTDPMTMEDYLAARMITTPLCLFDCDAPCDGSTVVIVSHRDFAPDLDHAAVGINALGTALRGRPSWDQFDDMTSMAARDAGASMWERTELTPADVDTAQLYDGFSILTVTWLEALGFCGRGESGSFIEGGANIARDGLLPLNTNGGQLSGGRLHGFSLIHEACVQLRGEGGERQIVRPGGRNPEVAAVANGGGPIAGTMLLTRGVSS
jgi:acetyl-CoA acetyltransferase